jgi:hypothetical protein
MTAPRDFVVTEGGWSGTEESGSMAHMAKRTMSDDHKAALAEGRSQGRAVRNYLEALESHKPKRGRKRTTDSMQAQLAKIDEQYGAADALKKLELNQLRLDIQAELEAADNKVDLSALEADFIASAKGFSERKNISYAAWRASGVEPSVLKKAGITRGS